MPGRLFMNSSRASTVSGGLPSMFLMESRVRSRTSGWMWATIMETLCSVMTASFLVISCPLST